jgi:hypothetical protein
MEGLIIVGGMLGTIYMATFIFCLLLSFESTDVKFQPLWSIPLAVFDAFKSSLIVFFWLLVGVAGLIVMLAPLFLSLYFVGFFN